MNLHKKSSASMRTGQRVVADPHISKFYDPPALSLDERGMILDCSKSFENLFGFRRTDLVWHHVSGLLPQLKDVKLVHAGEVNRLLNFLCHCGYLFQAQNRQGDNITTHLSFVRIETEGRHSLRLIMQPSLEQRHDSFFEDSHFFA